MILTEPRHRARRPLSAHTALSLSGVSKDYRRGTERVTALAGVDLALAERELVALVGPSGSGKSTLLHLAGGIDVPDTGRVRVAGVNLDRLPADRRAA